jgi:hypothetical protein
VPARLPGLTRIAGRIHPRLIDLVAALAIGTVGAFALARPDVSDPLPGVAIAIPLVPPLAVAGVLLEAMRFADAVGAILLLTSERRTGRSRSSRLGHRRGSSPSRSAAGSTPLSWPTSTCGSTWWSVARASCRACAAG